MEKVAIIILNWNTTSETIDCIESLKKQTFKDFAIYLVDNGSQTSELKKIETYLTKRKTNPKIIFIKNKTNLGFTGGNNVALKKAINHEYVFLLNNDTTLENKCIQKLLTPFEINSKIGAINPKIYYYSDKKTIWAAGATYSDLISKASLRGIGQKDIGQFDKPETVKQLVGAAVMIKSEALKKTGFFNEDYFCYYEETDLFHRMKQNGYLLYYEPKAIVYHKVAMSSGGKENPTTVYYLVRNRATFIKKNTKNIFFLIGISSIFIEFSLRFLKAALKLDKTKVLFVSKALFDFLSKKVGKLN